MLNSIPILLDASVGLHDE